MRNLSDDGFGNVARLLRGALTNAASSSHNKATSLQVAHVDNGQQSSSSWGLPAGHALASSLLGGSLLMAASPANAAASQDQHSPGAVPVSETATHPLEYDPVTNEHTAKMTMARSAGLDHYQAGRYPQAEAKFLEAVAEARLGFDAKDPHIASTLNNLAEFYRNTGQHAKAEQLYKEALDLLESAFGERHWLYVSAMHNLALSYEARGQLDAAKEAMERVMSLRLSMFGARHFLYADSMYALGHILLKQAAQQQQQQQQQGKAQGEAGGPQPERSGRRWWLFGRGGQGGSKAAASLERRGLGLMSDAVQALEDAESVQVNAVLNWLSTLGQLYSQRGMYPEALRCARKAMYHFANDKGEGIANASELSDRLIELLLKTGQDEEARDMAATCAAARQQLFGRELAVAQSWLRLATMEAQLKQADLSAALQHARNAAVLSGELLHEYTKASVPNWLGKQGQQNGAKRARAAHVHASALKFMADYSDPGASGDGPGAEAAVSALEAAVSTLESAVVAAAQQLQRLSSSAATEQGMDAGAAVDAMAGLYVELQLQLLDCLEALAGRLQAATGSSSSSSGGGGSGGGSDGASRGAQTGRLETVRARQEELSKLLLGS